MSRVRNYLSALAALFASGCATTADVTAPPLPSTSLSSLTDTTDAERLLLERVSSGLLYMSESDYPFVYFRHAAGHRSRSAALSITEFRSVLGIPPNAVVEVVSLDQFFKRHIELVDPSDAVGQALIPRFILLRETLRNSLSYTQVYRVGSIAIDCYIVGFDRFGDLQGLTTIAIET